MAEQGQVEFGDTTIHYTVVRSSRRRKTVQITLDPTDGVLVASPVETSSDRLRHILEKRAAWIIRRSTPDFLRRRRKEFVSGESLPYLGRQARLFVEHANIRRPSLRFRHWAFYLTVPAHLSGEERRAAVYRTVARWYRRRAADRLTQRVDRWSTLAGARPPAVMVRDQRQRWASCGRDGSLRFNWRIVMAPPRLVDYVVVHELVHLQVRIHSVDFWSQLGRLLPDYRLRRAALKELGPDLTI